MRFLKLDNYRLLRWVALAFCLTLLPACDSLQGGGSAQDTSSTETPATQQLQRTEAVVTLPPSEADPIAQGPITITVWLPDLLAAPSGNDAAAELLTTQIREFVASQPDVLVLPRLKRVGGVGGIMSTLRSASQVAPGVLPDITLMRRENLLIADADNLIQPLEGEISSATVGSLYDVALELGQVDGQLVGVPYMLDVQHMVFNPAVYPDADSYAGWSLSDVLDGDMPFVFPVNRATGVNEVLLMQYLSAGGRVGADGTLQLDSEVLLETLTFYEQAVAAGVIDTGVLDYALPADYLDLITLESVGMATLSSSMYLDLSAEATAYEPGTIPTQDGEVITMANGWIWVLTTTDPDRQAAAVQFIDWMLETERQVAFSEAVRMLPSQRAALSRWDNTDYATFAGTLLDNAITPSPQVLGSPIARAMQNALISIINGDSAEEAAQAVQEELADLS